MKNLYYYFFLLTCFSFFSFNVVLAQQDTTPPVLTLFGPPTIAIPCNEYYNEFGANAIDDTDGTIEVIREGESVCTHQADNYFVVYSATDKSGNTASALRLVIVEGDCNLYCGIIDDPFYAAEFNTQNDTVQTHLNTSVTIPVLENDCCSGLFVSITQTASFGTATVVDGQSIEYIPNEGFIGIDTIHYQTTNWWWTGARSALVIIEVGTTSIQANPVYPSLQIYPNPAKDFLNIDIGTDLASKQDIELLLFNTVGQLQSVQPISNIGVSTVAIEALQQGLYLFQLKAKGEILMNGKVLVE